MFNKEKKPEDQMDFSMDEVKSDICPACGLKVKEDQINITAFHIYVKVAVNSFSSSYIFALAHGECIDKYTVKEDVCFNLKPEAMARLGVV